MSDVAKNAIAELQKDVDIEKRQKVLREKVLALKERKIDQETSDLAKADKAIAITKNIDLTRLGDTDLGRYMENNTQYFKAAKNPISFIGSMFDNFVPLFRNNLILVGAETGQGKSTCVGNIIVEALMECKKILVITNEQGAPDFYNMVTCMLKGWSYTDHGAFTEQQINILTETMEFLAKSGRLTVIDDSYGGSNGVTTTIEGIESIFDNLIANKTNYDIVLLDYYQNVHESSLNPKLDEWAVQRLFANKMNGYKDVYPAPIVIMAQVKPQQEEDEVPFKIRLEGTKAIINRCTCVIEMIAKKKELMTEWLIIKSRFAPRTQGERVKTGYDRGRFVPHDLDFIKKVNNYKEKLERAHLEKDMDKKKKPPEETAQ